MVFLRMTGRLTGMVAMTASVCVVLSSVVGAWGQADDPNNAAGWYQRAFERVQGVSVEEMTALIEYSEVGGVPPAGVRRTLQRLAPAIADLQRAARRPYTDFNLNREAGFDMLLPHLGPMRSLARVVKADVKMKLADGNAMGAAQEVSSLYRLADHASDDRILISSLVGAAIFNVSEDLVKYGQEEEAFGAPESAVLLEAVKSYNARDPFHSVDAVIGEQIMGIQSMRELLDAGNPDGPAKLVAIFGNDERVQKLSALSREQIDADLDTYSRLMDRYVELFAGDDPEATKAALDKLSREVENGDYGVIAMILLPSLSRCYESLDKARNDLAARIDSLEGVLSGEVDPGDLANAAVWYRRGIAELEVVDEQWRARLAGFDPGDEAATGALIDSIDMPTQNAIDAAIAQFTKGSLIRHCDFARGRHEEEIVVPGYAAGMRDGFAILALDSLRLLKAGDRDGAAQRLAAGFRMNAHLGDDGLVFSAIGAQDGFTMLAKVGQALPTDDGLSAGRLLELANAVNRTSVADPFGFVTAKASIHDDAFERLRSLAGFGDVVKNRQKLINAPSQDECAKSTMEWARSLDFAGQWYVIAALCCAPGGDEAVAQRVKAYGSAQGDSAVRVILDLASVDGRVFMERAASGDWTGFVLPPIVNDLGLTPRMQRARSDGRDGARLGARWSARARQLQAQEQGDSTSGPGPSRGDG